MKSRQRRRARADDAEDAARELGWQSDLALLRSIPGVGPLTALVLVEAYYSGHFSHRDPFIAFLGLDVRSKDSGKFKGRRKLSKCGSAEARRLLYNAAMSSSQAGRYFHETHLALQARGLARIRVWWWWGARSPASRSPC